MERNNASELELHSARRLELQKNSYSKCSADRPDLIKVLVGAARFELATPCAQGRRLQYSGLFAVHRNVSVSP
jgi:hypothetical protein